jgi:hypothetical protein
VEGRAIRDRAADCDKSFAMLGDPPPQPVRLSDAIIGQERDVSPSGNGDPLIASLTGIQAAL